MSVSYTIGPGHYPGLIYDSTESGQIYHEDREIEGVLYRASNATFNGSNWSIVSGSNAYAVAQKKDGSLQFLRSPGYSPWTNGEWLGNDNNNIYNGIDYGMGSSLSDNTEGLSNAINAAILGGGGIVYIPAGVYEFASSSGLSFTVGVDDLTDQGVVIMGTGGSTELVQTVSIESGLGWFAFHGFNSGRGVYFRDLRLTFQHPPTRLTGTAILASHCRNFVCDNVYFYNCPTSFIEDTRCLQCGLRDCTVSYEDGADGAVMLSFTGTESFIDKCVIAQKPIYEGGPTDCVGLNIESVSGFYASSCHISDFTIGIQIVGPSPNPLHAFFSAIVCQSYNTSVSITPSAGNDVYQVFFSDCLFALTKEAMPPWYPGVVIQPGAEDSKISDIYFTNCMLYDWQVEGMNIAGGQNIQITGGRYGSCALESGSDIGAIAITGDVTNVLINGADCSGVIPGWGSTQPYGISITAEVSGVYIRDCDLTGNAEGPILLTSPGTELEITNCAGYNDQSTLVSAIAPGSGVSFSGATLGYYGPVLFTTVGAPNAVISEIAINGHDTHLLSGSFTLAPGSIPSATITYSGGPTFTPFFTMIGQ